MDKISFYVDGYRLNGNVFYPPIFKDKNPVIFFVQGWTGRKERSYQYAEALTKLGFICFLFDNIGHGESDGDLKKFTISKFLEGVIIAYDYMLSLKGVDIDNVGAIGSSFGAYLLLLLSEKRKLKKIVLRAPADYPDSNFDKSKYLNSGSKNQSLVAWRNRAKKADETFALRALHNFDGKILIIESEKDNIVPYQTVQNYICAIKDHEKLSHVVVKDAPHSIKEGQFRDEITKTLVDWFKNIL